MPYSLTWLPDVLLRAGLKVAEVAGWETRGHGDFGPMLGVLCHHTAGPKAGNMPSLQTVVEGRPNLRGPLSQLGLGRDGTYYVIAAGRAYHAGTGLWLGVSTGNQSFIGIEAENTGRPDDSPWPAVQLEAYQRGVAALLTHAGRGAEWCAGHSEYALPRGRKVDPDFDMVAFRAAVASIIDGTTKPPPPIPPEEPSGTKRPTLRRGSAGDAVRDLQRALGVIETGLFAAITEARVRAFQREHGLVPDGIVGPRTWAAIDLAALNA